MDIEIVPISPKHIIMDMLEKHMNERDILRRELHHHEAVIAQCHIALKALENEPKLLPSFNHIPEPDKMVDPTIVVAEMVDENNLHSYLHANKPIYNGCKLQFDVKLD